MAFMRMLLNRVRLWKEYRAGRVRGDWETLKAQAAFAVSCREVSASCGLLGEIMQISADGLAHRYMSCVFRTRHDAAWWQANGLYLTEAWFIYEYACENRLIERVETGEAARKLRVISPENARQESCVRLRVLRRPGAPECGELVLTCANADAVWRRHMQKNGFKRKKEEYVRAVGEIEGTIEDRAVETGVTLLRMGYAVCVDEPVLESRILNEDFVPEHKYWVLEGSREDTLELRYPRDKQLHGYVCRAGGRWTGKNVEITVYNSHMLDDVIRLYGFRITAQARARMDAWQEVYKNATIYRSRKRSGMDDGLPPVDRFRQLMNQRAEVIEDLYDDDD